MRLVLTSIAVLLLLFGAATALQWPSREQVITVKPQALKSPVSQERPRCVVTVVYDGDTFGCDLNNDGSVRGDGEKIRLLGIDTPEMHYSYRSKSGKDEPQARAASTFAKQTLMKKTVFLEYDQQIFDRYGRTLAYVYLDPEGERMVNRMMVQKGLAKALFIGINRRYEDVILQDEAQARQKKVGLWQRPVAQ